MCTLKKFKLKLIRNSKIVFIKIKKMSYLRDSSFIINKMYFKMGLKSYNFNQEAQK